MKQSGISAEGGDKEKEGTNNAEEGGNEEEGRRGQR